jgi:ligand-binding sensor domain-containing protein
MVSHKNFNNNVNEDFVIFLTSKLITFFVDGFTSGMKSQSIVYLLSGSAHIYWILDLEGEVHSIWGF